MPHVQINGTRLWVEDTGPGSTGETIAMSHGLLWSVELFRPQIERLRKRYRVVAWDHRGQGRSDDDGRDSIGMEICTDDALGVLDALGTGPVHFVGLSMGGFVGMRIAGRFPSRLRSLSLLNTTAEQEPKKNLPKYRALSFVARTLGVGAVADRILPIMFSRTTMTSPELAAFRVEWKARLLDNRRSIWRAVNGVLDREGVEHLLPRITTPTLVIAGEEDVATVPDKARRIHADVAGSKLVVVPGAGHSSSVERPDEVTAAIEAHVASTRAG